MTDAERAAAEQMRQALQLMPCACVTPGMYNYTQKRRHVCTRCRAIAQWDDELNKKNEGTR